jgi:hypothetical protein
LNPVGLRPERKVDDCEVKLSVGRSVDERGDAVVAQSEGDGGVAAVVARDQLREVQCKTVGFRAWGGLGLAEPSESG